METEETEGGEIFSAVMAMKTAVDAAIKAGDISQEAVRIMATTSACSSFGY